MSLTSLAFLYVPLQFEVVPTRPLPPDQQRSAYVLSILNDKVGSRYLAQSGPMAQPPQFWFVEPRPQDFRDYDTLQSSLGSQDLYEEFDWMPGQRISIDQIPVMILSGEINLPLVFKSDTGSLGEEVLFIERNEAGDIVLTTAYTDIGNDGSHKMITDKKEIFESFGLKESRLVHDENSSTLQLSLGSLADSTIKRILTKILLRHSAEDGRHLDNGILETKIKPIQISGRAFESRHQFDAALDGSAIVFKKYEYDELDGVEYEGTYARIGSSSHFSNLAGRESSQMIHYPHWFVPLMEELGISESRHSDFEKYVDEQIREQWMHILSRMQALGLKPEGRAEIEIDLVWLAPSPEEEFPRPLLMEMSSTPPYGIRGASPQQSCASDLLEATHRQQLGDDAQ